MERPSEITPDLGIPTNQEVVVFSSPNTERRLQFEEYMHDIDEDDQFDDIWDEVKDHNPLENKHYQRRKLTDQQLHWIKQIRDNNQDQAPFPHISDTRKEAHHISGQMYNQVYFGLENHPELTNHTNNLLTLSQNSHRGRFIPGRNEPPHPDVHTALVVLHNEFDALKHVFADHYALARDGIHYWFDRYDKSMFEIATERSKHMKQRKEVNNYGK